MGHCTASTSALTVVTRSQGSFRFALSAGAGVIRGMACDLEHPRLVNTDNNHKVFTVYLGEWKPAVMCIVGC